MSINDVTGARLVSKVPTHEYQANYALIFGDKVKEIEPIEEEEKEKCPFCGIMSTSPCDSPPPDICEQAINVTYGDPTK